MSSSPKIAINPSELSDAEYGAGCRVLASSVRCYFNKPGIKEEYQRWLKEYLNERKVAQEAIN